MCLPWDGFVVCRGVGESQDAGQVMLEIGDAVVAAFDDVLPRARVVVAHLAPVQHFVAGCGDQEIPVGLRDARRMDGGQFSGAMVSALKRRASWPASLRLVIWEFSENTLSLPLTDDEKAALKELDAASPPA